MKFIFLLALISAVAAAPVKRHVFFLLLQIFPFASASAPGATATNYPTLPGALPAVGGAVRGAESALPAVGGTLPAVAGSLDEGLVGGLVGPQGRDLSGGDSVEGRAASDVRRGEGTTSGAVIKPITIPSMYPNDAFVKPTGTYYPFATAGVDWKRQYGAGNSGEYGAGPEYDRGASVGDPYAAFDEWKAGRQGNQYGDAGGGDGGAGWDNENPYARRGLPRDAPSAAYDAGPSAAYDTDVGAGYDYGSHAGYAAGAGAGADGYTYVKASGSISGSYEAMMAGGGAMDGYGRAGMGAGMGSHAEADMNGRLWPHSPKGRIPPAYDTPVSALPAPPTGTAPSADHVPIPYATAAPDSAVPTLHGPGPVVGVEEPSYLADHGLNVYNIPEGPATDLPLQSYVPTDEPQDTAYPEPTYTANVAGEVPVNSPPTYDYPSAAQPTEWAYPSVDATDGLPVDSTPATDNYPPEAQPTEWIYPSVNEGSDYGATDAPTPTVPATFDPTLYTMMPAPHGLGMAPWGSGPVQNAEPTMDAEPTYAVQAVPTEAAASVIYK